MKRRTALKLGCLSLLATPAMAFAQAAVSMQDLSWVFWHEGVRLFDDTLPGNIRSLTVLRSDWLGKQGQNGAASAAFRRTSDVQLSQLLAQVPTYVESTFQLANHFDYTAYHEGQLDNYRKWVAESKFAEIRSKYASLQGKPNQHQLLAAMSNGWILRRVPRAEMTPARPRCSSAADEQEFLR